MHPFGQTIANIKEAWIRNYQGVGKGSNEPETKEELWGILLLLGRRHYLRSLYITERNMKRGESDWKRKKMQLEINRIKERGIRFNSLDLKIIFAKARFLYKKMP